MYVYMRQLSLASLPEPESAVAKAVSRCGVFTPSGGVSLWVTMKRNVGGAVALGERGL